MKRWDTVVLLSGPGTPAGRGAPFLRARSSVGGAGARQGRRRLGQAPGEPRRRARAHL